MKPGIILILLLTAGALSAQAPSADLPVDAATRAAVIDGTLDGLTEAYVFPDLAASMAAAIQQRVERHEYDAITSARILAETLTNHLQEVSHDKHLRVAYSSAPLPMASTIQPSPEELERQRAVLAQSNFGFEKIERLPGNIGYLDLRGFVPAALVGDTAAAAMSFLANVDAVIIDLRRNGGGDPATVALLSSYLFGPQPVHLNDMYDRPSNETRQWWTSSYVPGKRLAGKDVYLLTSTYTFSAAEEFAYNLQNLKRATIIGDTTGGGAHPGSPRRLTDHFFVNIPSGRAINPISKTNWEGTGVTPDVKVPAAGALTTAQLIALEKLAATATEPRLKTEIRTAIERLKKELNPPAQP